MKYEDFTLTMELKQKDFKKGTFMWFPCLEDFEKLYTIGQKLPTKKDKWIIELQANDLNVVGECDYNTARIINLMQDVFFDYKRKVYEKILQLREALEKHNLKNSEFLIKSVIKDLDLEYLG